MQPKNKTLLCLWIVFFCLSFTSYIFFQPRRLNHAASPMFKTV